MCSPASSELNVEFSSEVCMPASHDFHELGISEGEEGMLVKPSSLQDFLVSMKILWKYRVQHALVPGPASLSSGG